MLSQCFNKNNMQIYIKKGSMESVLSSFLIKGKLSSGIEGELIDENWFVVQSTLPKSNSHKSNNRLSRRSFQVLFSLYSIVFNPS